MHRISQMEKVIPSFQYEPLVLSLELETSNEEEDIGNIDGVGPLGTKKKKEEPRNLKGGKDNVQREVGGMTYASKQTPEPIESIYMRLVFKSMHFQP